MDDRMLWRVNAAAVGQPNLMAGRTSLTLAEGMAGLMEGVFINVKNRFKTITAEVEVSAGGANLDRIQTIKGWVNKNGELQEPIYTDGHWRWSVHWPSPRSCWSTSRWERGSGLGPVLSILLYQRSCTPWAKEPGDSAPIQTSEQEIDMGTWIVRPLAIRWVV